MRYVLLFAFALLITIGEVRSANADVVYVNLNEPGGVPGTGGSLSYNPGCYCGGGLTEIYSPIYRFAPGTTVDFGHLDIFTGDFGQSTPDAGPTQPNLYINGLISVSVSYSSVSPFPTPPSGPSNLIYFLCGIADSSCNSYAQQYEQSLDLVFTIPTTADSIQIEWGAIDDVYTPPVPEPSTWAMLLIGFAVIGLWSYAPQIRSEHARIQSPTARHLLRAGNLALFERGECRSLGSADLFRRWPCSPKQFRWSWYSPAFLRS